MIFPDFPSRGFDDLHEKFEKGWFADAIGADDGDSRREVDTKLQFLEKKRLIRVSESHIVGPLTKLGDWIKFATLRPIGTSSWFYKFIFAAPRMGGWRGGGSGNSNLTR